MHALIVAYASLLVASAALYLTFKARRPRSLKDVAEAVRLGNSPGGVLVTPEEADELALASIPEAVKEHAEHEADSGQVYDIKLWRRCILDRVERKLAVYGAASSPHTKAHIGRLLRG